MLASSRFFGRALPTRAQGALDVDTVQKPGYVDAGGNLDNMFHALAAGIIDNILTRPRTNLPVMTRLMEYHAKHFTLPEINRHLTTPLQRFEKIAARPGNLAQFIRDIALTLRQTAVTELCTHPDLYEVDFEKMSPAEMRKPGSKMPKSSIDAVANVLNIPVVVNEVETGKNLQKQTPRGPKAEGHPFDKVVMLEQHDYYLVQVVQVSRMEAAATHVTLPSAPLASSEQVDPSSLALSNAVKNADAELIADFERNVHRLETMVDAQELDKNSLLQIYISAITTPSTPQGQVKRVNAGYGSQRLFEDAMRNIGKSVPATTSAKISHDEQVVKELIGGIARGLSLGQMNEDYVFAPLEQAELGRMSVKTM